MRFLFSSEPGVGVGLLYTQPKTITSLPSSFILRRQSSSNSTTGFICRIRWLTHMWIKTPLSLVDEKILFFSLRSILRFHFIYCNDVRLFSWNEFNKFTFFSGCKLVCICVYNYLMLVYCPNIQHLSDHKFVVMVMMTLSRIENNGKTYT